MGDSDPIASLRPAPIDVEFGEWTYTIPQLPAVDWIEAVLTARAGSIFPALVGDQEVTREVWLALARGEASTDDLIACARAAVGAAGGRPWWEVDRLIRAATHENTRAVVLGNLARGGFDLGRVSLGMFCDAVYSYCVQNADEQQRFQLDAELRTPPPEATEDELMGDEEDYAAEFLAMVGDRGAG